MLPVAVDYTDVDALRAALPGPFDAALVYAPFAGQATLRVVRVAVVGPVVQLVTSAVAEPTHGDEPFDVAELPPPLRPSVASPGEWWRVVLGWRPDRRWHSPEEISGAGLQSVVQRRDLLLGAVRPWSDRPR